MHVRLRIGGEDYALPVECVRSVEPAEHVTPVLGAPPAVLGVRSLHGQLLPVLDLAALLGVERRTPRRILVLSHDERSVGFAVEDVLDVAALPQGDEEPASPHLSATVLVDGTLIGVIDVEAVLATLEGELVA